MDREQNARRIRATAPPSLPPSLSPERRLASVDGGKEQEDVGREKRGEQRNDRPTKPALTFSRTCTYRSVSQKLGSGWIDSHATADKGSSFEGEGRLNKPNKGPIRLQGGLIDISCSAMTIHDAALSIDVMKSRGLRSGVEID